MHDGASEAWGAVEGDRRQWSLPRKRSNDTWLETLWTSQTAEGIIFLRAVGIHPGFTSLSCCVFLIKSQRLRIQGCTATAQEDIASPAQWTSSTCPGMWWAGCSQVLSWHCCYELVIRILLLHVLLDVLLQILILLDVLRFQIQGRLGCFKLSGKERIKTKQTETDSALKPIRWFWSCLVLSVGRCTAGAKLPWRRAKNLQGSALAFPKVEALVWAAKIEQSKLFYCSQQEQEQSHFLETNFITQGTWWVARACGQKQCWLLTRDITQTSKSGIRALKSQCHGNCHEADFLLGRLEPREPRDFEDFEDFELFSWCSECLMHSS